MQFREMIDIPRKTIAKKILGNKYNEYEFFRKTPRKIINKTKTLIDYHRKTCILGEMKTFYFEKQYVSFRTFKF